jgi:integrase
LRQSSTHFGRKKDSLAQARSGKSLEDCLDAIAAFRMITGLKPITLATPDDCARFQEDALKLPKNWRRNYPGKKKDIDTLSPNTVVKWLRSLAAAFERANRNAARRKCVRGVVEERKLLTLNPWMQFTWIEGTHRPIRQFDPDELVSFLTFLETRWEGVPVGAAAAKVYLWSGCRKQEAAGLTWDSLRVVGGEYLFEVIGKWGVEKWFRVPETLYRELLALRTESPFVFAAYTKQLRQLHADHPGTLTKIAAEYSPELFGDWFYRRVKEWSEAGAKGNAFVHIFRKTTLQHARRGEDINRQVAQDARVSEMVLMTNYVKEADEEMRQKSNRIFHRIAASLPPELASRYGHIERLPTLLEQQMQAALAGKNWSLAAELAARLATEQ